MGGGSCHPISRRWVRLSREQKPLLLSTASQLRDLSQITLPDGNVKEGTSNVTTPFDIAMGISKGLAEAAVIAKVNGTGWDMKRPLEGWCLLNPKAMGILLKRGEM